MYNVSMTVAPKQKWLFLCDNYKEALAVEKNAKRIGWKMIYIFKHNPNYKKKGWKIEYKNKEFNPSYYIDFCRCCGRDF